MKEFDLAAICAHPDEDTPRLAFADLLEEDGDSSRAAFIRTQVALARVPLVYEALQRGELVEPFGPAGRVGSPFSYWMVVSPASRGRSEVMEFCAWVEAQSTATRAAVGQVRDAP